jgi:FtsH-binding integral membrane protein
VRLAVELWAVVIVAMVIVMIARYPIAFELSEDYLNDMKKAGEDVPISATAFAIAAIALSIFVVVAVACVVLKFTWDGRNWARQTLGVFSAFLSVQLVFGVISLFITTDSNDGATVPAWAMIFVIISGVAAIGALVALMHRDTTVFCRDVAAWRSGNRQNGGVR